MGILRLYLKAKGDVLNFLGLFWNAITFVFGY